MSLGQPSVPGSVAYNPRFAQTIESQEKARYNPIGGTRNNVPYELFQQNAGVAKRFNKEALKGIQCSNALTDAYFSHANIEHVQQMIRHTVYQKTRGKFVIDKQSETDLKIIMRSLFLQYGRNLQRDVRSQIKELNNLVVQECAPRIISEVEMYQAYLRRASGADHAHQLARPIDVSNKGRKSLPSPTSKFLFT